MEYDKRENGIVKYDAILFTQKLPNTPKKLPVTLIQKSRKKESYYITRM